MAEPLFVDTGYIRALLDPKDRFHEIAAQWERKTRR